MRRTLTVRGALSPSAPFPFLAELSGDSGGQRALVLGAGAVSGVGPFPHVVQPVDELRTTLGDFAVWPFVSGHDLHRLLALGALSDDEVVCLLVALRRAVLAVAACGRGLIVDRGAMVRVDASGHVWFVVAGLSDAPAPVERSWRCLLGELADAGAPASPAVEAMIDAGSATLSSDREAAARAALAARVVTAGPSALFPHPQAGLAIDQPPSSAASGPPPKATVARFASVTLVLGLLVGWMWAPGAAASVALVHAPDARRVEVTCAAIAAQADGGVPLALPRDAGRCEILWFDETGGRARGELWVSVSRDLHCRRSGGAVTCEPR